jgi:hypothetical protein
MNQHSRLASIPAVMRLWLRRVALVNREFPMTKQTTRKVVFRDSEDGKFVTEDYAKRHPRTTEREHVYVPAPKTDK